MKDDSVYLGHIANSISLIEDYTKAGKEAFIQSRLIQDAVIRNFEIIGEATKRLSEEFCTAHTEVPWRQVAGLRDVLIHEYFGVSVERVWQTIVSDVPRLKRVVLAALDRQL